jgi:ribosome-associated protein
MNSEQLARPMPPSVPTLSALDTARTIVDAASDKKAQDIVLLDVRGLSSLADYFVICSAPVDRQLRAIAEAVEEALDKAHTPVYRREGSPADGWVLLDYGDVIAHIMSTEQRTYYRLEQLWDKAHVVVRVQ